MASITPQAIQALVKLLVKNSTGDTPTVPKQLMMPEITQSDYDNAARLSMAEEVEKFLSGNKKKKGSTDFIAEQDEFLNALSKNQGDGTSIGRLGLEQTKVSGQPQTAPKKLTPSENSYLPDDKQLRDMGIDTEGTTRSVVNRTDRGPGPESVGPDTFNNRTDITKTRNPGFSAEGEQVALDNKLYHEAQVKATAIGAKKDWSAGLIDKMTEVIYKDSLMERRLFTDINANPMPIKAGLSGKPAQSGNVLTKETDQEYDQFGILDNQPKTVEGMAADIPDPTLSSMERFDADQAHVPTQDLISTRKDTLDESLGLDVLGTRNEKFLEQIDQARTSQSDTIKSLGGPARMEAALAALTKKQAGNQRLTSGEVLKLNAIQEAMGDPSKRTVSRSIRETMNDTSTPNKGDMQLEISDALIGNKTGKAKEDTATKIINSFDLFRTKETVKSDAKQAYEGIDNLIDALDPNNLDKQLARELNLKETTRTEHIKDILNVIKGELNSAERRGDLEFITRLNETLSGTEFSLDTLMDFYTKNIQTSKQVIKKPNVQDFTPERASNRKLAEAMQDLTGGDPVSNPNQVNSNLLQALQEKFTPQTAKKVETYQPDIDNEFKDF